MQGILKIIDHQDTGTCQKTIKVEVQRGDVMAQLDDVYKEFMVNASVPGFRKGKAPRHIVKMRYGKHIENEAVSKAVEEGYNQALEELDLHAVTQPDITELEKDNEDQPITFTASFEYIPEIELAEYKDIRPTPPETEVAEKDVVDMLDQLRENNAAYAPVEDRAVVSGDFVTIASTATIEDAPFVEATHKEIIVEVGTGRYIPGFEEQLVDVKIDESKSFSLVLPDDYPQEDKRGKEANFEVTVKKIQEKRLPELDDEFAKDMGDFENLDQLKERIRENLKMKMVQSAVQKQRAEIRDELLNRNDFEVPPSMVKARFNFINALQDMEYRRYGQSIESMVQQDAGLLERNEKEAVKEVRLSILLDEIAKKENIEATDEDYVRYIAGMARSSGADPSMYLDRIKSQGMDSYYRRVTLEEKVVDYLFSLAYSDDKPEENTDTAEAKQTENEDETVS
jgi:trigger factor